MGDTPPRKENAAAGPGGLLGKLRNRFQPVGDRIASGIASTINGAMRAAGLNIEVEAIPTPPTPPAPPPPPAVRLPLAPPPAALALKKSETHMAPRGPTPVQVMTAVQSAVSGAVKVVSGGIAGVRAATDAARAASKTATGAATVAAGVATVASGFFPQLASLGIGVSKPKAPKNRPGMRPQRRVADIIANPMGKTPPAGSGTPGAADPQRPTRRIQRIPMVRAKSSLEMGRKDKAKKPRSYADLAMRPQLGLTPHEILLKVATITLGKTLLGFLESGARAQQEALQRVSARMSEKQIMLLGMLPAQYIVQKLPPQPAEPSPAPNSARPSTDQAHPVSSSAPGTASGAFKIRY